MRLDPTPPHKVYPLLLLLLLVGGGGRGGSCLGLVAVSQWETDRIRVLDTQKKQERLSEGSGQSLNGSSGAAAAQT